jgi:hypothetical protein
VSRLSRLLELAVLVTEMQDRDQMPRDLATAWGILIALHLFSRPGDAALTPPLAQTFSSSHPLLLIHIYQARLIRTWTPSGLARGIRR